MNIKNVLPKLKIIPTVSKAESSFYLENDIVYINENNKFYYFTPYSVIPRDGQEILNTGFGLDTRLIRINRGYSRTFTQADLISGILQVNHGLDTKYMDVIVINNNDEYIIPDHIIYIDNNNLTIDLSSYELLNGSWILFIGNQNEGSNRYSNYVLTSGETKIIDLNNKNSVQSIKYLVSLETSTLSNVFEISVLNRTVDTDFMIYNILGDIINVNIDFYIIGNDIYFEIINNELNNLFVTYHKDIIGRNI